MSCFHPLFSLAQWVPLILAEQGSVVWTRPHPCQGHHGFWSLLSGAAVDFCVTLETAYSLCLDLQGPHAVCHSGTLQNRGQAVTSASPEGMQPELGCTHDKALPTRKLPRVHHLHFPQLILKLFCVCVIVRAFMFISSSCSPGLFFDWWILSLFLQFVLLHSVDQDHLLLS